MVQSRITVSCKGVVAAALDAFVLCPMYQIGGRAQDQIYNDDANLLDDEASTRLVQSVRRDHHVSKTMTHTHMRAVASGA